MIWLIDLLPLKLADQYGSYEKNKAGKCWQSSSLLAQVCPSILQGLALLKKLPLICTNLIIRLLSYHICFLRTTVICLRANG